MKNLHEALRATDPAAEEGALGADEARAMREAVLSAVPQPRSVGSGVSMAAAAMMLLVVGAGLLAVRRSEPVAAPVAGRGDARGAAPAEGGRRQLLFATPGGTRIVWTFNDSFALR